MTSGLAGNAAILAAMDGDCPQGESKGDRPLAGAGCRCADWRTTAIFGL